MSLLVTQVQIRKAGEAPVVKYETTVAAKLAGFRKGKSVQDQLFPVITVVMQQDWALARKCEVTLMISSQG